MKIIEIKTQSETVNGQIITEKLGYTTNKNFLGTIDNGQTYVFVNSKLPDDVAIKEIEKSIFPTYELGTFHGQIINAYVNTPKQDTETVVIVCEDVDGNEYIKTFSIRNPNKSAAAIASDTNSLNNLFTKFRVATIEELPGKYCSVWVHEHEYNGKMYRSLSIILPEVKRKEIDLEDGEYKTISCQYIDAKDFHVYKVYVKLLGQEIPQTVFYKKSDEKFIFDGKAMKSNNEKVKYINKCLDLDNKPKLKIKTSSKGYINKTLVFDYRS